MYKIFFTILLGVTSTAIASTSYWFSLDTGKSMLEESPAESHNDQSYLGGKFFISLTNNQWNFDIGFGAAQHKLETKYSSGVYEKGKYNSQFAFLYLAPRYNISSRWSLAWENMLLVNKVFQTAQNKDQNIFSGVGLGYDIPISTELKSRINLSAYQGMDLDKDTKLVMISLQLGYDKVKENSLIIRNNNIELKNDTGTLAKFSFDGFELDQQSLTKINKIIFILKKTNWKSISIEGHTDRIGNQRYNLNLSEKRASKVRDLLIKQDLDENKIKIVIKGESELVNKGRLPEDHAENRRVILQIYYFQDAKDPSPFVQLK